jgi:hypothetical protein
LCYERSVGVDIVFPVDWRTVSTAEWREMVRGAYFTYAQATRDNVVIKMNHLRGGFLLKPIASLNVMIAVGRVASKVCDCAYVTLRPHR